MKNLFDRAKLFFSKDREFRSALYDIMGFCPHNIDLYRTAFAHKSQEYRSKKLGNKPLNNERLEFLGDAVLETVVSHIVYRHFPNKREGFLTNTRSKIVSRESLGKLAKELHIDRLIQSQTHSRSHNSYLGGNSFEALMGAIYLDRGFHYAFRFVEKRIIGAVLDLESVASKEVNFKSKLLEWSQKNRIRLDFKDSAARDKGNGPSFVTTIVIEGLYAGEGKGFSKKESHQAAAKDALTKLRREPNFLDGVFRAKEKRTAMGAEEFFVLPKIDEIEAEIAREKNENTGRKNPREQQRRERNERTDKERQGERKKTQTRNEKAEQRGERNEKSGKHTEPRNARNEAQNENGAVKEKRSDNKATRSNDNDRSNDAVQKTSQQNESAAARKPRPAKNTEATETTGAKTESRDTADVLPKEKSRDVEQPKTDTDTVPALQDAPDAISTAEDAVARAQKVIHDSEQPTAPTAVRQLPDTPTILPASAHIEAEREEPTAAAAVTSSAAENAGEDTEHAATTEITAMFSPMRMSALEASKPEIVEQTEEPVATTPSALPDTAADTFSRSETESIMTSEQSTEAPTVSQEIDDDAFMAARTEQEKKRARRKKKTQNAADYTNTTPPPAEQSRRAEKAERRQQEAAHEREVNRARQALADVDHSESENEITEAPSESEHDAQPARRRRRGGRRRGTRSGGRPDAAPETGTSSEA